MKQWAMALVMVVWGAQAHAACALTSSMDTEARKVFRQHGAWHLTTPEDAERFERKCQLLQQHGLALQISANAAVLNQVSIGMAHVFLKDIKHNIFTADYANYHTIANTEASQDKADALMAQAIVQAFVQWPEDRMAQAAASLQTARKNIRKSLAR